MISSLIFVTAILAVSAQFTDLPGWKLSSSQNFDQDASLGQIGTVYGMDMRGYSGFGDTSGNGQYTPDKVLSAHDGMLDFYVHTENGIHLVAAPIPEGYVERVYGRFSIRFKSDALPKYGIAFMLWPTSDKWIEGELDFPEGGLGATDTLNIFPHGLTLGDNGQPNLNYAVDTNVTASSGFHVYTTEWYPGGVRYLVDGVLLLTQTREVPVAGHRWTLQMGTQVSDVAPDDSTSGHLLIDWLAIWDYIPGYDYSNRVAIPFTGTDGSALPSSVSSVRGTNTIQGNRIRQVTSTSQWSITTAKIDVFFTDGTITATLNRNGTGVQYLGFRFDTSSNNGYALSVSSTLLILGWWNGDNFSNISSAAINATSGVDYKIRIQASAGGLRARFWPASIAEPFTWNINEVFAFNSQAGKVALFTQTPTAGTAAIGTWVDLVIVDALIDREELPTVSATSLTGGANSPTVGANSTVATSGAQTIAFSFIWLLSISLLI